MFTSVEFVNLSTLQIGAVVFSLKHKRGAVIAKNVKLPPRLSYSLNSPPPLSFCLSCCFEIHFSGPIIGPILMSDKIFVVPV